MSQTVTLAFSVTSEQFILSKQNADMQGGGCLAGIPILNVKILLFCTFVTEGGRAKAVPRETVNRVP